MFYGFSIVLPSLHTLSRTTTRSLSSTLRPRTQQQWESELKSTTEQLSENEKKNKRIEKRMTMSWHEKPTRNENKLKKFHKNSRKCQENRDLKFRWQKFVCELFSKKVHKFHCHVENSLRAKRYQSQIKVSIMQESRARSRLIAVKVSDWKSVKKVVEI